MKEIVDEQPARVAAPLSFDAIEPAVLKPQLPGTNSKVHPPVAAYVPQEVSDVSDEEWDDLLMSPNSADMLIEMADKAMEDFDAGRTKPLGVGKK